MMSDALSRVAVLRRHRVVRHLLGVLVVFCPSACKQCEDEQCDDYLSISFAKATPWELGTYQVDLILDGEAVACSIEVPYGPEGRGDTCDDEDTQVATDSFAKSPEISFVGHFGAPRHVEITLSFEGTEFFAAAADPEYQEPPGWNRRCGPACNEGGVDLSVP